eukprot:c10987_g1_i1.p1 GENE.c10987_g1_i1~~c10987_g1_i1.p1  ORF type:complete len:298 (+),score=50.16 c10987_g1_i1:55-948(+)
MLADSVAVRSARVPSTPHEVANLDTSLKYQSIHAIVSAKQFKLLSAHVRAGGDIDEVDTLGQTALHHSCQSGDDVAVYFLLREGANVNAADYRSITPLHLAIQNGFGAISERLLYSGADFALQNEDLLMPFQLRVRRLDPDIGATVGHRQKKPALKKWFSSRAFTRRAKPSRSTSTDKGLRNKSPSTFTVASSAVEYSSDNPQDVQIAIRRFFTPPDGKFAPHILEKTIDKVTALGQWMGKQAAVFHRTRVVVTYDEVGEVRVLLVPHGYIQADPSAQRRDGSAPITALVNLMRQCM